MRLTAGIAIAVLSLVHAANAEPSGPDAQTLVWWQADPRAGAARELAPWVVNIGQEVAIPCAMTLGEDPACAAVVRVTVTGVSEGWGVAGEAMASENPEKPGARSAWVRLIVPDTASGEKLLRTVFGSVDAAQARQVGDAKVFTAAVRAGDPAVLWTIKSGRLIVATTERAMARATGAPAEGAPESAQLDYEGLLKAREECRPGRPRAMVVYLGINRLRHEFEQGFIDGRGSRLLSAWKLANARGAAVFVGYTEQRAESKDDPMFVHLDVAYSSRSDAPGVGRCTQLTVEGLARSQLVLRPPGASVLMMLKREPPAILDWAIRTYRATLSGEKPEEKLTEGSKPEPDKTPAAAVDGGAASDNKTPPVERPSPEEEFAEKWRSWLQRWRSVMQSSMEDLQPLVVIGLDGRALPGDPPDSAAFPFRISVVRGTQRQRTLKQIGEMAESVGAVRVSGVGDGNAGWRVPFALPWLRGSAAWTDQRFGDVAILTGVMVVGDGDPVKALPAQAKEPARP